MNKYRVMIIDDDADARKLLALAIRDYYEVVEATDGLDALSKLETYEPDMAIIDVMMPMMDGFKLCEAIRCHPKYKSMQIMFLSANGTKEAIKKGYAVGANLFMTKPVDPERVLKNLDFTLEHEPPPFRNKTLSLEQIERMAQAGPTNGSAKAPERKSSPGGVMGEPVSASMMEPACDNVRILAVDDDPEMLQMLSLTLRDDYEMTTAVDGVDAIERMVSYEPDILLLDIMMPKMNGYQLLQSIRRNAYIRELPVVVVSAKSGLKEREYAARMGATYFLAKPFSVDDLIRVLARITRFKGFKVRPKKMTMFDISDLLYAEDKDRREREDLRERKRKYQEIQGVIDKNYDAPPTKRQK